MAWHRYESLLNPAFAGRGVDCVCPYDTRTVGDDVIATAHRTHGTVVTERGPHPSGAYVDAATFCAECDAVPLPSPPVGTVQQIHFSTDLVRPAPSSRQPQPGLGSIRPASAMSSQ